MRPFLCAAVIAPILSGCTLSSDAQRRAKIRITSLVNRASAAGLTIHYFGCMDEGGVQTQCASAQSDEDGNAWLVFNYRQTSGGGVVALLEALIGTRLVAPHDPLPGATIEIRLASGELELGRGDLIVEAGQRTQIAGYEVVLETLE